MYTKSLFRFNRLSFGVSAAPAIFKLTMGNLLQGTPHAFTVFHLQVPKSFQACQTHCCVQVACARVVLRAINMQLPHKNKEWTCGILYLRTVVFFTSLETLVPSQLKSCAVFTLMTFWLHVIQTQHTCKIYSKCYEDLRRQEYAWNKTCCVMLPKVQYLSHVISRHRIRPAKDKVQAIQEAPVPKDVHQLKSFLGLLKY